MNFLYEALPSRVIFASGARRRAAEGLARLGVKRALLLSTPAQVSDVQALATDIGSAVAGVYANATMHTPTDITRDALEVATRIDADGLLAFGGGSTIGLGKAIALRTDLPQLVIPTTFAGSEMTPIIGETDGGKKVTQVTRAVLPETVIYDPDLIATLPPAIAGPSGMNAVAHAVEALYAENANPITSLMAEEAIRALAHALPRLVEGAGGAEARAQALYGAWLAGVCLGSVGMALHHKICHTLGGAFDLPHADVHCLMIPYSTAFNREAAPDAMARIARAVCADDAPSGLFALMQRVGVKKSLATLGMQPDDLDRAADLAVERPYYNPRPVTRAAVRAMLQAAYEGVAPV